MRKNASVLLGSYLTVAQAARQLNVHPSSIRRWIDQGRLPSYRIGDKRIGVRPADLAGLVAPRPGRPSKLGPMGHDVTSTVRAPSMDDQRRGLVALAQIRRLRDQFAAKYGASNLEGWELLNQSRDERTSEAVRATKT